MGDQSDLCWRNDSVYEFEEQSKIPFDYQKVNAGKLFNMWNKSEQIRSFFPKPILCNISEHLHIANLLSIAENRAVDGLFHFCG